MRPARGITRRTFLAASAGAFVAACGGSAKSGAQTGDEPSPTLTPRTVVPTLTADGPAAATATQPLATPTPVPPPAEGTVRRIALEGTPAATEIVIHHSGIAGPAAVVLSGVHGNEPGAWFAGDEVAGWLPARGSLAVIARCNVPAIAAFERTTDADLNRAYPGKLDGQPMERMAYVITELCRELKATLLLDMHESWAFFREYPGTGTGALGQTITVGIGPLQGSFGAQLRDRVNGAMSEREQMLVRDGTQFSRPP
ncbi:MAG: succinylglutamate desuccinylase/aspartoacylase family protein, partial [Dehalococcoidia bacterium]